ncbi:MAG: hypothetical protein FWD46_09365 [Cystobacterineae bacterium]|nr:hypothetical protein [Cystobacterineae bacterium]
MSPNLRRYPLAPAVLNEASTVGDAKGHRGWMDGVKDFSAGQAEKP